MDSLKLPRLWPWATAVGLSAVCIVAAARFTPAGPPAIERPEGLTTDKTGARLTADAPQWRFLKLGVAGAAMVGFTDPIPARIAIDETQASRIGTPLPGRVSRVFVELGQHVTKGQPLFSVASGEIADLRVSREKAAVDLDAAKAAFERVQATVASRALPEKEEASARQQLRQAELAERLAEDKLASLHVASDSDNEFTVSSPRDGAVVEKNLLPGQQVTAEAGSSLMVVADLSSVWVMADLFENQASEVRPGALARVTSPSMPELELEGRAEMVSAVVDPVRHTVPVRVRLANPEGQLRPNIYARVRFATRKRPDDAVEIPASALVSDGDRQYVYVEDTAGHFVRREVTTGSAHEGRVPVIRGLARGETIVEEGAILRDNQLALAS